MQARRFLRGVSIGVILGLLGTTLPTVLVDPTGYLGAIWPAKPQVCARGISADSRVAKLLMVSAIRPREIFLGTSRIDRGFAYTDVVSLLKSPAVNVALDGASLAEIEATFFHALASGRLERAWIGIDFGLFVQHAERHALPVPEGPWSRLIAALWEGDSISSAYLALTDSQACKLPLHDLFGFASTSARFERIKDLDWQTRVKLSKQGLRTHFARAAAMPARTSEAHAAEQWRILQRMIQAARREKVAMVFFVAPAHRYYRDAIASAGLAPALTQWRRDMAAFCQENRTAFFDWSDYAAIQELNLEQCEPSADNECPMYDVNHFRPVLGRAMLARMLSQLDDVER